MQGDDTAIGNSSQKKLETISLLVDKMNYDISRLKAKVSNPSALTTTNPSVGLEKYATTEQLETVLASEKTSREFADKYILEFVYSQGKKITELENKQRQAVTSPETKDNVAITNNVNIRFSNPEICQKQNDITYCGSSFYKTNNPEIRLRNSPIKMATRSEQFVGTGEKVWFSLSFDEPKEISSYTITTGVNAGEYTNSYVRIKKLAVYIDGDKKFTSELENVVSPQKQLFGKTLKAKEVVFEVLETYSIEGYKSPLGVTVTELKFN